MWVLNCYINLNIGFIYLYIVYSLIPMAFAQSRQLKSTFNLINKLKKKPNSDQVKKCDLIQHNWGLLLGSVDVKRR